jgi:hypothetical protein
MSHCYKNYKLELIKSSGKCDICNLLIHTISGCKHIYHVKFFDNKDRVMDTINLCRTCHWDNNVFDHLDFHS